MTRKDRKWREASGEGVCGGGGRACIPTCFVFAGASGLHSAPTDLASFSSTNVADWSVTSSSRRNKRHVACPLGGHSLLMNSTG